MNSDMTVGVLVFMMMMVFGTMIGTYQIASLDQGYVVIPSSRYCDDNGYVKAEKKP
jgi:hypothetical protein